MQASIPLPYNETIQKLLHLICQLVLLLRQVIDLLQRYCVSCDAAGTKAKFALHLLRNDRTLVIDFCIQQSYEFFAVPVPPNKAASHA
jgi:hypothetical protein